MVEIYAPSRECILDTETCDSSYSTIYPCRCQGLLKVCHGKVKVTAQTEFSPDGDARQQTTVTVRVYHP